MPRTSIYLSVDLQKRLAEYRWRERGSHHSLSAIVQKAIKSNVKEYGVKDGIAVEEG